MLLSQAAVPASGPIPDGAATLIGVLGERLTAALQRNSPAMVCSASLAAGKAPPSAPSSSTAYLVECTKLSSTSPLFTARGNA